MVCQLALDPLALRDVVKLSDHVDRLPDAVSQQRAVQDARDDLSARAHVPRLEGRDRELAREERVHRRQVRLPVVWVRQLLEPPGEDLLGWGAEIVAERVVYLEKAAATAALDAEKGHPGGGALECALEELHLVECFL